MSQTSAQNEPSQNKRYAAEQLVKARLEGRLLEAFPGALPPDIASGYRCQDAAIALWPDRIGGWKSTMHIPASRNPPPGDERLVGPVFERTIYKAASGQTIDVPIFTGGRSGIEPEIVAVLGHDAPPDKLSWTPQEARELIGSLHVGAEVASTPVLVPSGLPALAADFVMNFGMVQGPEIAGWREIRNVSVTCFMDDQLFEEGAIALDEDPLQALAFILSKCAQRGRALRAGMRVLTGTMIPFRPIDVGQVSRFVYEGLGEVICRAVSVSGHQLYP